MKECVLFSFFFPFKITFVNVIEVYHHLQYLLSGELSKVCRDFQFQYMTCLWETMFLTRNCRFFFFLKKTISEILDALLEVKHFFFVL